MKITDMQVHKVELPLTKEFQTMHSKKPLKSFQEYLVKVYTDEGIAGIGSCWLQKFIPDWEKYLNSNVKPFLLNKTVDQSFIEQFTNHFHIKHFNVDLLHPPGCVEMALWDIIGKKEKLPIYKLHDGTNNKIKAYASILEPSPSLNIGQWVKLVNDIYEDGFKAVKIHIGTKCDNPKYILDVVKAIRNELGNNIEIMVDVMQAWVSNHYDFSMALQLARIYWKKMFLILFSQMFNMLEVFQR